ncbi:sulfur carrier protein ThiS [Candidatus Erwinia haradaeae]|uniref:Sulfur carrier protein ThiS n=1 Tax=Candidatus Erwinia haradaeae TaxID=1922217 RepID=A0A451D535_9GAMM|nr:sulfur carrier protein ThiS [Candidatus Erwinia haradaeae]VFP80842.1 Sulfur carrier protein ThiS [Candidatus Erwinia haradaeae]
MKITFNNHSLELQNSLSITEFLSNQFYKSSSGMALALNQTVIPQQNWSDYQIKDGDDILLFQAIAGG